MSGEGGSYWLLNTVTPRGLHLTPSWEVEAVPVPGSRYNTRVMPFRLTPAAIEHGATALQWRRIDADHEKLHEFLRHECMECDRSRNWLAAAHFGREHSF